MTLVGKIEPRKLTLGMLWRTAAIVLIALGFVTLVGGALYDVVIVNIPYQDPPPELAAEYARKYNHALLVYWISGGLILFGAALLAARWLRRRR